MKYELFVLDYLVAHNLSCWLVHETNKSELQKLLIFEVGIFQQYHSTLTPFTFKQDLPIMLDWHLAKHL